MLALGVLVLYAYSAAASTIPCGEQAPGYEPDISPSGIVNIVGGSTAKAHSWPWQVAMVRHLFGEYMVWCGGVIISDRWMATAAHCLKDITPPYYNMFFPKVGAQDRGNSRTPNEPTQQVVMFDKAFTHPLFNATSFSHDIVLLKSITNMTFNDYVRPVCLPSSADVVDPGSDVVITGWGDLRSGQTEEPRLLQQVEVPVVGKAICGQDYPGKLDDTMLCAGDQTKGGHDSCNVGLINMPAHDALVDGDSGGPLTQKRSDGKWYLEGLVSWGYSCAIPAKPGVYHRVASTVDWIRKVMSEN